MSSTSDQAADAKQRFMDLKVGNVDLVDEPANLVDFLARKSMEGSPMSTATSTKAAGNTEGTQGPSGTSTQPPLNDKGTNVSADLSSMVAALSKACSGGDLKLEDEEMKKNLTSLNKALTGLLGTDCGNNTDKSSKKSSDKTAAVDTEKAGGKQFTKERMETIANSLKGLLGMFKSLDEEAYKALTAPDPGEGTAGVKPLIPTSVADPETQKALKSLAETVSALTETVTAVSKKVAAVDAGASKTEPDNGTEDTKATQKSKGDSFWSGVL